MQADKSIELVIRELGLAAGQDFAEPARPRTPHGIVDHLQTGRFDRLDINVLPQVNQVCRLGIEDFDQALLNRLGLFQTLDLVYRRRDASFNLHQLFGSQCRTRR